ncbi:MAG: RsmE family RNA methyltransferase [Candidatus Omnitrophota bacterium]
MLRLFCSTRDIAGGKITISDIATVHHVRDVLRVKAGEEAAVCDEAGNEYSCVVEALNLNDLLLAIKSKNPALPARITITAACAIPKKSKFEDIVDKLTQVGVDRIIPMLTERVIIKLDKSKEALRLGRWQKIALSAAEQSQRRSLPQICPVQSFQQVLQESKEASYGLKLIPYLTGERKTLKEVLASVKPKSVLFLIGPEGDFSPQEASLAINAGFIPVSLGDLVLRVETAAVSVASFIRLNEDY